MDTMEAGLVRYRVKELREIERDNFNNPSILNQAALFILAA